MLSLGQPWGRQDLPKGTFPSIYHYPEIPSFWGTDEPDMLFPQSRYNLVLHCFHIKKKKIKNYFIYLFSFRIENFSTMHRKNPLFCGVIDRKTQWGTCYYIGCLFLHWKLLLFLPDIFPGNNKVKMFYYTNYIHTVF